MKQLVSTQELVEHGIKHLPPSSSDLNLLDIGGRAYPYLNDRRDIVPHTASLYLPHWSYDAASMDAIMAIDYPLTREFLIRSLKILRPGGRLICLFTIGTVTEEIGMQLGDNDYVRILAEVATPKGGVLLRGERVHTTSDTHQRIQVVASSDADGIDWSTYRGRYIHFLVKQTPNKPVWKLSPDEIIQWHAVGLNRGDGTILFAFSSLPKAVAFMQPAIVKGIVQHVNKIAKYSIETVREWQTDLWLNPEIDRVSAILSDEHEHAMIMEYELDIAIAEQSDE